MKFFLYYGIVSMIIAILIGEVGGVNPDTAAIIGLSIPAAVIIAFISYHLFTRRGRVRSRAAAIKQIREENRELARQSRWRYENRKFLKRLDREREKEINRLGIGNDYPSSR